MGMPYAARASALWPALALIAVLTVLGATREQERWPRADGRRLGRSVGSRCQRKTPHRAVDAGRAAGVTVRWGRAGLFRRSRAAVERHHPVPHHGACEARALTPGAHVTGPFSGLALAFTLVALLRLVALR